jgi:hypothetical protein
MGREQCLEAVQFGALRLKTGRKGPNFHQARGFPHWNARKLRNALILTGNLGAQKIGLGDRIARNELAGAQGGIWARR